VQVGYHLTPFWSPTDRHPAVILDEAIEVVRATAQLGFEWVSMGQHWLSYPTVWPAPIPFLARLAPETGAMRIKTSVLLLPLINPVEVAENVATLDHLTHGRPTVGVSIGYRETELAAAGVMRRDRASKLEQSLAVMKRLKQMGVRISIDDFGTGYSSLSYLKRFPIDTVKIDQNFVRDLSDVTNDGAIITAVISMARALNLRVVAEGVETEEQLAFLRKENCEVVQGFLHSRPVTAAEFESSLRARRM